MPRWENEESAKRMVTCPNGHENPANWIRYLLALKGFRVLGSFSCRGLNTIGLLRLVGGYNRGRPNDRDLDRAAAFAARLAERVARPETGT